MPNEANQAIGQEAVAVVESLGLPPVGIYLLPENCHRTWPAFVVKHSLRQREGELVSDFITRFENHNKLHVTDWKHFSCPDSAQALFCLGGFRNTWVRNIINKACHCPRNIREIKICLTDFLPYIHIAVQERRVRQFHPRGGIRLKRSTHFYPWENLPFLETDITTQVSQAVWAARPLGPLESPTYEIVKLN